MQFTMSSMVNLLAKTGRWRDAIDLFYNMRDVQGVRPNIICYNAAVNALAKGSEAEQAAELVLEMQRDGFEPDVYTYAPLISVLGSSGRTEEAAQASPELSGSFCGFFGRLCFVSVLA